ncbi:hypothetical protein Tco_0595151 [Tanacetum coccineum]
MTKLTLKKSSWFGATKQEASFPTVEAVVMQCTNPYNYLKEAKDFKCALLRHFKEEWFRSQDLETLFNMELIFEQRKKPRTPLRVRALVKTIILDLSQIDLNAQTKARKT